jgi:glycosyltransferase involved in cell wall biosynthesis
MKRAALQEAANVRVGIIGHLLSFTPGYRQAGVSRYTEHLLRWLPTVAPGDDFIVFASRSATVAGREGRFPPSLSWALSRFPTERPPARIAWEQAVGPIALQRHRVDLVHGPVNISPVLARHRSVVTVHDLAFLVYPEQYPGAKQRYLNLLTGLSIKRAGRVIAVSDSTRADILRYYGVHPERVVVVPNGVDPDFAQVSDPNRLKALRDQYRLPEQFILFVGTLQPRKNLVGLLRAYARIVNEVDWPLVVVGAPGWLYEPVFNEARWLGVADRVIFAGYADPDALPLWYSAASVFVYPSLYEGFGLPVLEAMACGTPVITSSTSSLPEVAGDAAIYVNPADVVALASALARLIHQPALQAELRERGQARARRYSWEQTARETAEVYRQVAGLEHLSPRHS